MQKAILEEQIGGIALQLPALPPNIKEVFFKIMPYLGIVWLVLGILGLVGLLAIGVLAILTLALGPLAFLSFVTLLATVIMTGLALPGLFNRRREGWVWLYYAELVGLLSNVLSFSLFGIIVGLLWLYLLFQIRESYA
ncbi:MAG: hypothetical protein RMI34_12365 [Chloroherpetonaceae bacterium]|nr:hypothetical protein [Chloroherpetonaceae bacterium]MDW8020852.1 hypothetical protein [Chloroherpetonaceae bacterium]